MAVPVLSSQRLLLRPRGEGDMDAMMEMAGDADVMRFFRTRPGDDLAAYRAELLCRVRHDDGPGLGFWSLFAHAEPTRYLGWVSLTPLDHTEFIEIGYRLVRGAWGQGYATEAARRVLEYGFATLALPQIVAIVHPENLRSQAVMPRLGLHPAGTHIHHGQPRLLFHGLRPNPSEPGISP
jgi:RimJ/RimL family protein N-acetyltransferase